jgi:AraC-like DNA-binding protein
MKNVRSLLIQRCDLYLPGLRILQVAVNRHQEDLELIDAHHHGFDQFLLYLTGGGVQKIGNRIHDVRVGSLFFVPRTIPHAFRRDSRRRPLSVIVDLQSRHLKSTAVICLNQVQINQVRHHLSSLTHHVETEHPALESYGHILLLMDLLFKSIRGIPQKNPKIQSPLIRATDLVLSNPMYAQSSLFEISKKIGYQRDYLNRVLRREIGLTLGQYRSQRVMENAQKLLDKPQLLIQEISAQLGFSDQNYFARWFKQQTGLTPGKWRSTKWGN